MKFKIVGVFLVLLFICSNPCYASNALTAPYNFIVDTTTVTQTTVRITLSDSNSVAPDSLAIRSVAGSDTTWHTYLTVGSQTAIIQGLSPRKTYIMFSTNVRNDSCMSSNKDTLTTVMPRVEDASRVKGNMINLQGARYDTRIKAPWDSLYVPNSTGSDSTQVYWAAEYLGLQAKAIETGDSCQVKLLVFCGEATTDHWAFENVAKDSLVITKSGWTMPKQLAIPPSRHIYIRADGQTDNGYDTKLLLRLFRYGEISQ